MKRDKFDTIMDIVDTIVNTLVVVVLVLIIGSICISEYNYMSTVNEEVVVEVED